MLAPLPVSHSHTSKSSEDLNSVATLFVSSTVPSGPEDDAQPDTVLFATGTIEILPLMSTSVTNCVDKFIVDVQSSSARSPPAEVPPPQLLSNSIDAIACTQAM